MSWVCQTRRLPSVSRSVPRQSPLYAWQHPRGAGQNGAPVRPRCRCNMVRGPLGRPKRWSGGAVIRWRWGSPSDARGASVSGRNPPAAVVIAGKPSSRRPLQPCVAWLQRMPNKTRHVARLWPLRGCRPKRPGQPGAPKGRARTNGRGLPRWLSGSTGGGVGGVKSSKPNHKKRWRRPRPLLPTWQKRSRSHDRGPRPTLA